ncbi:MAG: transposase [Planctomycetota bacterium]
MPRTARASAGGLCYHVLNRGNAGTEVFRDARDYAGFVELLQQGTDTRKIRLLAYCLMPDHFHMVLWPRKDGDLSHWMQWIATSHVRRYHQQHQTSGHIWEGRFRAFPIQPNENLLTVLRYVEQNPLRLKKELKVRKLERWHWSSVGKEVAGLERPEIEPGPMARGPNWLQSVQQPLTAEELALLRRSVVRGTPFGDPKWQQRIVAKLGLESTVRPRGRPRKTSVE